ncbi:PREDICTED: uncharacterized protein LOC105361139 [Ceratosolen solmsi marchali]|uniref:Uncharacterized protein LOC105361139 n=1 Tax=Ceratosolen solmsi marchali TaxID=326594 RepID=A0AAJ6YEF5_9HYME|nr:PREDICTED: uncharacterized protein LOC105361139 [Ceratosolen solmsi marchali]
MSSGGDTLSANPTEKEKKDALYENRERKKIVRIITVTAYMFSVSFVGIVLSAYYIFLWHPPNPRMMHAQAMSVQSDGEIDFLVETSAVPNRLSRLANLAENDSTINVFSAQLDNEKIKTRREIIKNVNAVLRANFEKAKYSESSLQGADHM